MFTTFKMIIVRIQEFHCKSQQHEKVDASTLSEEEGMSSLEFTQPSSKSSSFRSVEEMQRRQKNRISTMVSSDLNNEFYRINEQQPYKKTPAKK